MSDEERTYTVGVTMVATSQQEADERVGEVLAASTSEWVDFDPMIVDAEPKPEDADAPIPAPPNESSEEYDEPDEPYPGAWV